MDKLREQASLDKQMRQTLLVVFLVVVATHLDYSDPVLQIQVQQINLQTPDILKLQHYQLPSSVYLCLMVRSQQKKKIKVVIKKMNRKMNLSYLIQLKRILPPTQPMMHSDLFKIINQKKKTPLTKTHLLVIIPV